MRPMNNADRRVAALVEGSGTLATDCPEPKRRSVPSRALITAVPFGVADPSVLGFLDEAGIDLRINPIGRKLTEDEITELIPGFDILIAGTEPITDRVIAAGDRLRLISRVGAGLDSVDLCAARRRGVTVAYTPVPPADAVAELTIAFALSLLRGVHLANAAIRKGIWQRIQGRRLAQVTVGVVGIGRIGSRVMRLLAGFGTRVLANDIVVRPTDVPVDWVALSELLRESDVVSLHVPLTRQTRHLVGRSELAMMRPGALLINTCRGEVIDETAVAAALREGRLGGAAIDTFSQEPYQGELLDVETCLLSPHMGAMAADSRRRMEQGAAWNAVAFLRGEPLDELVPEAEYDLRAAEDSPVNCR